MVSRNSPAAKPPVKKSPKANKPSGSTADHSKPSSKTPPKDESEAAKTSSKPKAAKLQEPEVVYHKIEVKYHTAENPLTADMAKKYLGWTTTGFDKNHSLLDLDGNKVWLNNNLKNRPVTRAQYETIKQDILHGRWVFNGDSMVVSKYGNTVQCQHRLIALVLADQTWQKQQGQYSKWWPTPPALTCIVVRGTEETPNVINTYDTGKPRTLADAIYQSHYFSDKDKIQRGNACRATDYAIRMLWHRTGADDNAFTPRRTMAESMNFLERHSRVLEMVNHVLEENDKQSLTRYLSPGYFSALAYLMAASDTERQNDEKTGYIDVLTPDESNINFDRWDQAQQFICLIGQQNKKFEALKEIYGEWIDEGVSLNMKLCCLIKTWSLWIAGEPITPDAIRPKTKTNGEGIKELIEHPSVGGIDFRTEF